MAARLVRSARWLLAATVAMMCAGCPRLDICVKAPDTRASSFVIELAEGSDCDQPAMVTRLVVRRVSDGTVFWTIGSSEALELTTVRYGEVPPGFDQGIAAQPLAPGEHVNISVNGRGTSGGVDVTIAP